MASISFEFLFKPAEDIDTWLTGLFDGAPLLVALAIAFLLGLRHASDPDHLVAVTSLVAAEDGDTRAAARLGAWWGLGHAAMLVVIGIPLIAFKSELPVWLESGAEKAIGLVIVVLALRVIWKWFRGDFRAGRHAHPEPEGAHSAPAPGAAPRARPSAGSHPAPGVRRSASCTGSPAPGPSSCCCWRRCRRSSRRRSRWRVFAPMSIASMALCTTAFAWVLTRRIVEPVYRSALIPAIGLFGVTFGVWYMGLV